MRRGTLYQHYKCKDTCFMIINEHPLGHEAYVEFYNLHSARMTGRHPVHFSCGEGNISLQEEEDYTMVIREDYE